MGGNQFLGSSLGSGLSSWIWWCVWSSAEVLSLKVSFRCKNVGGGGCCVLNMVAGLILCLKGWMLCE